MSNKTSDLATIRHSVAHIMAQAVTEIFPGTKVAIGPAIDNGFYYDFDLPRALTPEDLNEISQKMVAIIREKPVFTRRVVDKDEALALFADQPFKQELINELSVNQEISIYRQSDFIDLCRGPHVESAGEINEKAFKLTSVAGAYWRGDESRPMLQRIYGTAWNNPKDLRKYLDGIEEAKKRDHRRVGGDLRLFSLHEEAGAGLVYWHPDGGRVRQAIEDFWRTEHRKNGYELIFTPHIGKQWLWQTSGHLDFYAEGMYPPMTMDSDAYYPKPMNCPFHIMIYKTHKHSYRDLPYRWAELGTVYRYEKSGVLHGLLRVRGFTQDDAHIICTPGQMPDEILRVLRFSLFMLRSFGFTEVKAHLATQPPKSVGGAADWRAATQALRTALETEALEYEVDEGGGAFYGPKIDLKIKDAMGRDWQLTTVQFDFNLSERFGLKFTDRDSRDRQPFMIHRALLGSLERFFGILIEHYGGAFPVWLAPTQVTVIPVASAFAATAQKIHAKLQAADLRAAVDLSEARMNAKIRAAQQKKIPYMVIVGEREEKTGQAAVRFRTGEQQIWPTLEEFTGFVQEKINSRRLNLN